MGRLGFHEWCLSIDTWVWVVFLWHSLYPQQLFPKSISDGELRERAKRESWWGKGMEGRCLGSVRKRAETGIFPGLVRPRWLLSGLVLTWFLLPRGV